MPSAEASEYEKQRQANIAERDKLLKELALHNAGSAAIPRRPKPTASRSKKAVHKKIKQEVIASRKSSRLAGIEADSDVAKRKAEQDYEVAKEVERAKRQRRVDDLKPGDILVNGNGWDKDTNAFIDVINRGARPYERTFGETEVKETSNKELKALREKMSGLKIYETFEPNSRCNRYCLVRLKLRGVQESKSRQREYTPWHSTPSPARHWCLPATKWAILESSMRLRRPSRSRMKMTKMKTSPILKLQH